MSFLCLFPAFKAPLNDSSLTVVSYLALLDWLGDDKSLRLAYKHCPSLATLVCACECPQAAQIQQLQSNVDTQV